MTKRPGAITVRGIDAATKRGCACALPSMATRWKGSTRHHRNGDGRVAGSGEGTRSRPGDSAGLPGRAGSPVRASSSSSAAASPPTSRSTSIRRLRERGASVRAVMTRRGAGIRDAARRSARSPAGKVFTDLFDRDDEHDIGHIRLAREADLDRRRAGDRRPPRQDGARPRRRSRHRRAARRPTRRCSSRRR